MIGPARIPVLLFEPGQSGAKLVLGWCERDAVRQIKVPIAQREELHVDELRTTERVQPQRLAGEEELRALAPSGRQGARQRCRAVVQSIVVEDFSTPTQFGGELTSGFQHIGRQFGIEDVAVLRRARDYAEQREGRTADDDRLKVQSSRGEMTVEGCEDVFRVHGYQYN